MDTRDKFHNGIHRDKTTERLSQVGKVRVAETRGGVGLVECCFTSTETVGLLGTGQGWGLKGGVELKVFAGVRKAQ